MKKARFIGMLFLALCLFISCQGIQSPDSENNTETKTNTENDADSGDADTDSGDTDTDSGDADTQGSPSVSIEMIRVPSGIFQRDGNSENISKVSSFKIGRYEITYDQFEKVMDLEGYLERSYSDGSGKSPATFVSWYDAIAFCNKLSISEGLKPVYKVVGVDFGKLSYADIPWKGSDEYWNTLTIDKTADGYRLPTETEWMWAAMDADRESPGKTNKTGYLKTFAGSNGANAIGDYAVFGYRGTETGRTPFERSNPVGSRKPNALGIYDMSGNASEWCFDWYLMDLPSGTYPAGYSGPADTDHATFACRCIRGGSWYYDAVYESVANRASFQSPWYQGSTIGFRVVQN